MDGEDMLYLIKVYHQVVLQRILFSRTQHIAMILTISMLIHFT